MVYVTTAQHATLDPRHYLRPQHARKTNTNNPDRRRPPLTWTLSSAASWLGNALGLCQSWLSAKSFADSLACNREFPDKSSRQETALCSATFPNLKHGPIPFPDRFTCKGPCIESERSARQSIIPSSMVFSLTALSRLVPRLKLEHTACRDHTQPQQQQRASIGDQRDHDHYCRRIRDQTSWNLHRPHIELDPSHPSPR